MRQAGDHSLRPKCPRLLKSLLLLHQATRLASCQLQHARRNRWPCPEILWTRSLKSSCISDVKATSPSCSQSKRVQTSLAADLEGRSAGFAALGRLSYHMLSFASSKRKSKVIKAIKMGKSHTYKSQFCVVALLLSKTHHNKQPETRSPFLSLGCFGCGLDCRVSSQSVRFAPSPRKKLEKQRLKAFKRDVQRPRPRRPDAASVLYMT